MANGKIKADTLEHSTAGSLDTSYVVNGSSKAWNTTSLDGTTIYNSFNISSLSDTGTGLQDHNVTNNFATTNHVPTFSVAGNYNQQWTSVLTTSSWRTNNFSGSAYVDIQIRTVSSGDLA